MGEWLPILLLSIAGSELVLTHLIGTCPAINGARKIDTAVALACAIVLVTPLASGLSLSVLWLIPLRLGSDPIVLPLIAVVVLIAIYASFEILERTARDYYRGLEPFAPLLGVNCALLAIVLLSVTADGGALRALMYAIALALGYAMLLVVFAGIRERLNHAEVPAPLRDAPIAMITMGIIAMVAWGLNGAGPG